MPDGTKPIDGGVAPLTPQQKMQWNGFIDFLDKQGVKGHPDLDAKDKNLGQYYFQKYQSQNPNLGITYQDVPRVQQGLQDYRNQVLQQWKAGKADLGGLKDESNFMPGISKVDGWMGSKTSTYKFPQAILNNQVVGLADPIKPVVQTARENGIR